MKAQIAPDGSLVIPTEFWEADAIVAGQSCEIERVGRGEYRLRIGEQTPNRSWVDILLDCPEKGFLSPEAWCATTADPPRVSFE